MRAVEGSRETRWKFAVSTSCCINMPLLSMLQGFHDAGVRAVELGTPPRHFDPWRHDQIVELSHRLREFRLAAVAVHAPFGGLLDLTDPNPHHRHAAIGAILSAASALRELGGRRTVVHLGDSPRSASTLDERLANGQASLRILARACAHMDVLLAVETPLPHLVGGDPDEFGSVMKPLDRSVGVCLDVAHATLGQQWERYMNVVGHRVSHVHASDHRGSGDDHLCPGDGIVDWARVREDLQGVGFEGWVVLELASFTGPLSDVLFSALRRTGAAFGLSQA
ncbi:MAG: sugar phosphate isomerase/epimerase family protein [Vicinamibacterales bacterium]